MMRADNAVNIVGSVIKGPFAIRTKEGKTRCRYQIEIKERDADTGQTFMPFCISRGNQAEKDLANLKPGMIIAIGGRISTRYVEETRYFINENGNLIEKTLDELTDDDVFETLQDKKLQTEIIAEDVLYTSEIIASLPEEKRNQLFNPKFIQKTLEIIEKEKREKERTNIGIQE